MMDRPIESSSDNTSRDEQGPYMPKTSKHRSRWKKYGIILIFLLGLVIAAELILMAVHLGAPLGATYFAVADDGGYQLRANAQSTHWFGPRRVTVTIGSGGLRLTPRSSSDHPDHHHGDGMHAHGPHQHGSDHTHRYIHLVGDSQVFGWGLSDHETIAARLQSLVKGRYQVINYGVPGTGPYNYVQVLDRIPVDDLVFLFHAEQNDLANLYYPWTGMTSRSGFLVEEGWLSENLPTFVMHSHLFQTLNSWRLRLLQPSHPVPHSFHPHVPVARFLLMNRLNTLYEQRRQLRGDRLKMGLIPWDGEVVPERREYYQPKIDQPKRLVDWPDDLGIHERIAQHPEPDSLFLPGDPHLSPAGAELVANILAQVIIDDAE